MRLYQALADVLMAIENHKKAENAEAIERHTKILSERVSKYIPKELELGKESTADKLVFHTKDGLREIIITSSLACDFFRFEVTRSPGSGKNEQDDERLESALYAALIKRIRVRPIA